MNNKIQISEIYPAITGEIENKPATFIRFSGCNLIKEERGCKYCDSLYAEKGQEMDIEKVCNEVKKYGYKNVVITGGESLHQKNGLVVLVEELLKKGYRLDIETNGTLFDKILWRFDNVNCSPKKQAIDFDVLNRLKSYNTRFKFVYENDDCWWEDIINKIKINKDIVYIMPEGKTREEQLKKMPEVIEYCLKNGYNFSPRMHILCFDNERRR